MQQRQGAWHVHANSNLHHKQSCTQPSNLLNQPTQETLADESHPGRPLTKLRRTRSVGRFDHTQWDMPWETDTEEGAAYESPTAHMIRMAGGCGCCVGRRWLGLRVGSPAVCDDADAALNLHTNNHR